MNRGRYILIVLAALCSAMATYSCRIDVKYTSMSVVDSVRHYSPILRGDDFEMEFLVTNTGDKPLIIDEILTSCGCVVRASQEKIMLPPKRSTNLLFRFNSSKNTGYVSHEIYLYGNMKPKGTAILKFDVNVVLESYNPKDYEELVKSYDIHSYTVKPQIQYKK